MKKLFAIGASILVAFSLSLSSFASTTDIISLGFPFFGHTRVRQGGTQVYLSSEGSQPITSDSSLSLSGSGGTLIFDFYPMSHMVSLEETDTHYLDWPYVYLEADSSSEQYLHFSQPTDSGYNRVENPLYRFESQVYYHEELIDNSQYTNLTCNTIDSGSYVLEGTFVFDNGVIGNLDTWQSMITGLTATVVDTSSNSYPVSMTAPVFQVYNRNNKDFVNFRLCLNIPYSGQYSRLFFQVTSKSSAGIPSLKGFFVNTASVKFQTATNTQSLSILLGSWVDKIIGTIKANAISDDDTASQAVSDDLTDQNTEAQSDVQRVENFESDLHTSLESNINNIDLTVPTSFSAPLAFVRYVFQEFFNRLGVYQVSIMVPLILGFIMLFIGRGILALGRWRW